MSGATAHFGCDAKDAQPPTVYVVTREGVHTQGLGGVFSTLELATQAALALARSEPDNYHNIEVKPYTLDTVTPRSERDWCGSLDDPDHVFWTRKDLAGDPT